MDTAIVGRKQFSRFGLGAFTILAVASALQIGLAVLLRYVAPDWQETSWLVWLCTFAPMYLVAVPLGLWIIRNAPALPRQSQSLSFGKFLVVLLISFFMMYAGNLAGTLLTTILNAILGAEPINPVMAYAMDGSLVLKILCMVILAPMIEEYIFRKQLIDRMNAYGEKLAVVTSAMMFALFHGNLSQMFYAFALGLVFGYVYLRTGKLRYSIILHMVINFMGGVIAPAVLELADLEAMTTLDPTDLAAFAAYLPKLLPLMGYGMLMMGLAVTGLVFFCIRCRKLRFDPAPMELPKGTRFRTVYLNIGMLLLIAACVALIVLTFL